MPNLPISQLPELTAITSNAEFAVAQGGTTYRVKAGYASSGFLYLSAYETVTQSGFTLGNAYSISASTIAESNGITVIDGCKFEVQSGGTFNLQFSLQVLKTQGGTAQDVDIWLAKNGNNVDWSNTNLTLANNNDLTVASWNFVISLNAGDYLELKTSQTDSNIIFYAEPAQTSPTRPGIPSSIVTIVQI